MGSSLKSAMTAGMLFGLAVWVFSGSTLILFGGLLLAEGWWIGMVPVLAGALFIGVAYRRFRNWKEDQDSQPVVPEVSAVKDQEKVLFHWVLSPERWREFVQFEIRQVIKFSFVLLVVFAIIVFIISLSFSGLGLTVTIVLTAVIYVLMTVFGIISKWRLFSASPEVIFKDSGLILNGKVILYRDEMRYPKRVVLLDTPFPILAIHLERYESTRRRKSHAGTIRVPVPPDKVGEVERVQNLIMSKAPQDSQ